MEEDSNYFKFSHKPKNLNFNPIIFKNKINSPNISNNNNILNIEDFSEQKLIPRESRYLLVKKINLKEKKNFYYTKALKHIFYDINKYLEHSYDGRKIVVGKECTSKGLKELRDYFFRRNRRRRTVRKNDLKSNININFNNNKAIKNKSGNTYLDVTKNSTDTVKNNNTNSNISKFARKDYMTKFPLSDYELKKIYQEGAEREKNNKNEKIEFSSESTETENTKKKCKNIHKINKIKSAKFSINNTERMNINSMLHLQEKILRDRILKNKLDKKITNKIMSATFKDKSKLLMNKKKELIIIKNKEIKKEYTKFGTLIKQDKVIKNWLSELRLSNNKENKKINTNKKEIIYNNNINSSMEIKDKYNNSNINKIIGKNILKIRRPSLFRKYQTGDNFNNNDIIKNISVDNRPNNKNGSLNIYHNLYIKGKNLLEQEIKLSKELFGKKKKIINYSYGPEEISSILFTKSKSLKNINTPKAIINSIEIHNLGK